MRCPNCQNLNPSHAKFCMECGMRLLICPYCQTANFATAKFCIECGNSLRMSESGERDTVRLPEPVLLPTTSNEPGTLMAHVSENQFTAPQERRIVTIMFADITGSTPLADRLDPEDMRAILTGYFNLMTEQIRRHDGTIEKYIGDAVMAVFGAPVAHEDDPDRAIRAALDMQTALNDFNLRRQARDPEIVRLQMRIGINTGEVAATDGGSNRQDFLITGDAVNIAARLQQIATPDTILIGERTYLATREAFDFRSLAPLQVKGKTRPLNAWAVQGLHSHNSTIRQHPRGIEGLQADLVGRSLELTLMHATYARVRDAQHSHLITLLGSPGVGKSRLIREFIEREEEASRCINCDEVLSIPRVLQGHCPPYGEGITYWPLVEILRSLIQVNDGESRETLERRFVEFVHQTLRQAKRSEDVDQVASVLLYAIGRDLRGDPGQVRRRDIQRSTHNKEADKGGPQAALQRACRILFEAIAQLQPLILVIDDLQWADEALLDLLEYLTGHITTFPMLFICLARPDFLERRRDWGGGQPNFTTIILDALNREETDELISSLLATHELPDVLLHTIQQRTEGNPFFVEEFVRMLIDQRFLIKGDGVWSISSPNESILSELASPATPPEDTLIDQHYVLPLPRLPDTIQGVLAARIDLLTPVEKQVIQSASIIGRTFWVSAILELVEELDRETVLSTLEQLMWHDFIEESEKPGLSPIEAEQRFSFKHILIHDVVYNNIPRMRRSQKHAELALWIERQVVDRLDAFTELLAYHYQHALENWSANLHIDSFSAESDEEEPLTDRLMHMTRPQLVDRTIHYLALAGDQAYHSYYTIRAIQAYIEALDLLQENAADTLTIARMHQKLGCAYIQRANADEAWREYIQALNLFKGRSEVAPRQLLNLYMQIAELSTRWLGWFNTRINTSEIREYIDAGLKLVEGEAPSGEQASFYTYQAMWYIREVKRVPFEQRAEMADRSVQSGLEGLRIAEEVNDVGAIWIALDALGFIYDKQCRYADTHTIQHRRQKLQGMIQGREELYDLYNTLGWAHQHISDYAKALMWFGHAWRIAQTMESPSMLLSSMKGRLTVWYQWDRWEEAREVATMVLQTSEQYQQDPYRQIQALDVLAELAYRTGDQDESEKLLRQRRRLFEQSSTHLSCLPGIHAAHQNWAQALTDLQEIVRYSEPFPSPAMLAYQAELTVLAGRPLEEQKQACARAVSVAKQANSLKFLSAAWRAYGRLYFAQEQWNEAEEHFQTALRGFADLDLPWEQGETLYCLGQLSQSQADSLKRSQTAERTAKLGLASLFFEQSLGFFSSLRAVHDVQRTNQALAEVKERGTNYVLS
jgi:predicted ATPase/class 3 adenylate cyclase